MRVWSWVAGMIVVAGLAVIGWAVIWNPTIAPIEVPSPMIFPRDVVARGGQLASLGFCASCHTVAGGRSLAGGRPLATPFGTIFGTNITPDAATGIGGWSLEAFNRAMRRGIDRRGHYLYPAFPYSHFTKLTDGDIEAVYDYLMTREPVHQENHPDALRFPFNIRPLMAGWNLLYLRVGPSENDDSRSDAWNHGAYLAESLSHCGACHSPRDALGAEVAGKAYGGGEADGWWAPSLDHDAVAPVAWTEASLFDYLRTWTVDHGAGAGPMQPVVASLAQVPEPDVRAIATYVASFTRPADPARADSVERIVAGDRKASADASNPDGALVYQGACAECHDSGGQVPFTLRSLALHSSVWAPDPRDVVNAVRHGIEPPFAKAGGIMPPFGTTLTDRQVADVVAYVRARFSDRPAWTGLDPSAAKGPS